MVEPSLAAISMSPWCVSFRLQLLSGWWWSHLWWDICKAIVVSGTMERQLYTEGPLCKDCCWKQNPLLACGESLLICCFLSNTFSQEPIGRILGVEIWDKVSNKRDKKWNTLRQWVLFPWPAAVLAFGKTLPSFHYWFYFDYECLQLSFPYLPYIIYLTLLSNCWPWGEKSYLICVWEFSVAGNLPLR